jgi:hypothetical protein
MGWRFSSGFSRHALARGGAYSVRRSRHEGNVPHVRGAVMTLRTRPACPARSCAMRSRQVLSRPQNRCKPSVSRRGNFNPCDRGRSGGEIEAMAREIVDQSRVPRWTSTASPYKGSSPFARTGGAVRPRPRRGEIGSPGGKRAVIAGEELAASTHRSCDRPGPVPRGLRPINGFRAFTATAALWHCAQVAPPPVSPLLPHGRCRF